MRWLMPEAQFFTSHNVPKLQYVPILIADDGSYPIEPNTYIVERSCGEWGPKDDEDPTIPTIRSRQNMASRLCAFFRFCHQERSLDWRCMAYQDHLIETYQVGLLRGTYSITGESLSEATANVYLDEAVLFLSWASERGHRPSFHVPSRRVRRKYGRVNRELANGKRGASQRFGKLQVINDPLPSLPSELEVSRWLRDIRISAPVKALLFELILRTGARLSEANQMRTSCFPNKEHQSEERWNPRWIKQGWVPVKLRYGVKGGKVEPASTLSVRSRIIEIPMDLAERIWHYKSIVRPTLLKRLTRGGVSKDLSGDRLWLGEQKKQPVSNQMLYKAWTKSARCPKGWNPHDGRHFFAVEKICEHSRLMMVHHGKDDPHAINVGWLHGLMAGYVRLILSPLLGHVREDTTMRYLKCALHRLVEAFGHPTLDWNDHLDSDL